MGAGRARISAVESAERSSFQVLRFHTDGLDLSLKLSGVNRLSRLEMLSAGSAAARVAHDPLAMAAENFK